MAEEKKAGAKAAPKPKEEEAPKSYTLVELNNMAKEGHNKRKAEKK